MHSMYSCILDRSARSSRVFELEMFELAAAEGDFLNTKNVDI